jgi:cytochrome c
MWQQTDLYTLCQLTIMLKKCLLLMIMMAAAAAGSAWHVPFIFPTGEGPETNSSEVTVEEAKLPALAVQQEPAHLLWVTYGDFEKGKLLIERSGCISCHQIDQRITGPAYLEIAKKYTPTEATVTALTAKIINGGSGNWGQMSMDPHPYLKEADVREMVKYILSLAK